MEGPLAKMPRLESESSSEAAPVSPSSHLTPSSAIEALPRELFFKVLEYAPETAKELMKTSKLLHHAVDKYALNANIPLVERISFGNCRLFEVSPETKMDLHMNVDEKMKYLFYRRLHLLHNTQDGKTVTHYATFAARLIKDEPTTREAEREEGEGSGAPTPAVTVVKCKTKDLRMSFELDAADVDERLGFLSECIGRRVANVRITQTKCEKLLGYIDKLLAGKQIVHLDICTADMCDENVNHFKRAVMINGVSKLSFAVTKFETTVDTLELLRDLAKQVRTITITQYSSNADANNQRGSFLFGKSGVDWPTVFVDMLSSKLDKLIVENTHNLDYLNEQDAFTLIDRVAAIKKPVWFEATCDTFVDGYADRKNDYNVHVASGLSHSSFLPHSLCRSMKKERTRPYYSN